MDAYQDDNLKLVLDAVAPASEDAAAATLDRCLTAAVKRSHNASKLAIQQCAADMTNQVMLVLSMVSPFLQADAGDSTLHKQRAGREPISPAVDRHASSRVQKRPSKNMLASALAANRSSSSEHRGAGSEHRGPGSVMSSNSRKMGNSQALPSKFVELFQRTDERGIGSISLNQLQFFLSYHGHHKYAESTELKQVLQQLDVNPTEPIRAAHFCKYLTWLIKVSSELCAVHY
jgi:hypothetical protein